MRKLSIRKKINALTAAIAIIAFVAVLFALALTLPSVAIDIKGVSADNASSMPSEIADIDNTVTETGGNTTLEFLEPDEVKGLEDGGLPIESSQYILAKGYESDGNWLEITSADGLKTWLTGSQNSNAYLAGNITGFSHGTNDKTVNLNASIKAGKTLDGCGFTVNIEVSGTSNHSITSGGYSIVGFFVKEVLGTLKNTKFTFKKTDGGTLKPHASDNNSLYAGLLIGCIGPETAGEANMAVVENVSLEVLPFDGGGSITFSTYAGFRGTAHMRTGCVAGVVKNGTVRNVTLIQTGGTIYQNGGNGTWGTNNNDSGTMIGQVGWGDKTAYVYNISSKGNGTYYKVESSFKEPKIGTIGIVDENIDIRGMFVEALPNTASFSGTYMYVSQPIANGTGGNKTDLFSKSLYSRNNGDRAGEAFFRLEANQEIRFAKPNPVEDTMSLADYQATCTRVIINDTSASDSKILWRVNRASSANVDSGVFDQYQTYPLMKQAGAQTYISMSTRAEEAVNGTGGNRIQFVYGDKVTLSEIPNKTAIYNGVSHTTAPVFKNASNSVFNADASKYNVLYNNSATQPILPSSAAYNVTIRASEDAKYAYLDTANRVIAPINDSITATININYADISVTSVMCDGVEYTGNFVNKPINYTVAFKSGVTAPSSGFRIEYRESTAMGWSSSQTGLTASVTPTDGYNIGDKTYRFRVLAQNANGQWVEVSNPTTEEMTFKYDDFRPETQYISSYADGTWHTAASDVIINPKPVIRYAPATVQVRYIDSAGNPLAGADGQWHKADGTFQNDEGYWMDGFKISQQGKTYFQLQAQSVTGAVGDIKSYEVWIDRTTYTIDYEVSFVSGIGLDKSAIALTGKTEIKRDEKPKLTLNTIDNGALSYYIAEVSGTAYNNEMEATYNYSMPLDMAIGDTPEIIKIKVRKGVKLTFTAPSSVIYGDKIKLPTPNAEGLINGDTFEKLNVTVDFVSDEVTTGKVKAVGEHEFTASINNGDYVAIVENSSIEVTPRELRIDFRETYRFILDTYISYGKNAWQYLELKFRDSEKILEGDSVNITGVTYDAEIKVYGTYHFEGIIDNDNYKLPADDYGTLILTMLEYNYDAFNGEGAYMLRSEKDFKAINEFPNMLKQNFILMNDIDLSELADAAIKGTFEGKFDGQNYKIYNLLMIGYGLENYGLFYKIVGGEVKNLVIDNMSIGIYTTSKNVSNVGLLAGEIYESNIDNVIIRGEIRITDESALLNVGGIAGAAARASITNIGYFATIEVYSKGKVMYGGVVGDANNLKIQNVEYIGIATVKSNVTESSVGYASANNDANTTITNVNYINKSIGFNGTRVDNTSVGTSVVYNDLAESTNTYAGIEYGSLLKGSIDPRYFGKGVYGTNADDAFVITNYNQLVATVIYPYATFKLENNIICHTVNMYDPSNFFGTLDMNGYSITDIGGKDIQQA